MENLNVLKYIDNMSEKKSKEITQTKAITKKKYNYKVKTGRPTKYIPKTIFPKIEEYFEMVGREQTSLPTIEGLALHLGVNPDTIYEWGKKYPKLSETLKKIMAKQKQQLIDDGMYGGKEVNAAMAIFLLKVNHGMKESDKMIGVRSDGESIEVVIKDY